MSIGVNQFNQIEVTLSPEGRRRCRNDAVKMHQMQEHTKSLMMSMLQSTEPLSDYEAFSLDSIDPFATISLSHRGRTPNKGPLIDMVLSFGRSGEHIFQHLLEKIEDPNAPHVNPKSRLVQGTVPLLWVANRNAGADYLSCLIDDSRVNVETPNTDQESILNYCCKLLHQSVVHITPSPSSGMAATVIVSKDEDLTKREFHIQQLLRRDALLDPVYVEAILYPTKKSGLPEEIIRPYIEQWQEEWEHFSRADLKADHITSSQFKHFLSLGKLVPMIQSGVWDGQYEKLSELIAQLPEWVALRHPLVCELTLLAAKEAPERVALPARQWADRLESQTRSVIVR